jgi:DNA-binding NtrC family response regulator
VESKYQALVLVEDPVLKALVESALDVAEFRTIAPSRDRRGLDEVLKGEFHMAFMGLPGTRLRDDSVFKALALRSPPTPCIIVAGEDREQEALEAVEQGAYDYVLASDSALRVRVAASRAIALRQDGDEILRTRAMLRQSVLALEPAGGSPAMIEAKARIERAAGTEGNVIIEGEPGTGKRTTARTIHSLSRRQAGPFVEVSCNLVPESLVESEFFGIETGIYGQDSRIRPGRVEQASGGTLYLEDIHMLPPRLRNSLLHAIRAGEVERVGGTYPARVNVRIIASSTMDLEAAVYSGSFPKELYDALGSLRISLPALRTRKDDIPLLLKRFLKERGSEAPGIERPALQRLLEYHWPGNLEELRALAEGLWRLGGAETITAADLPDKIRLGRDPDSQGGMDIIQLLSSVSIPEGGIRLPELVDALERTLITKALDRAGGLRREAARLLGLKRTTLLEKIRKKEIS